MSIAFILNESRRPDAEVRRLVEFAYSLIPGGRLERGSVAIKVVDGKGGGHAQGPRTRRRKPRWQGRNAYHVYLTIPTDDSDEAALYGMPHVCWHSARAVERWREVGLKIFDEWIAMYDAGERRYGRWPIYCCIDWRDYLVHLAAHEIAHIVAYDSQRTRGLNSEIQCELYAEKVLDRFRDLTNATGIGMLMTTSAAQAATTEGGSMSTIETPPAALEPGPQQDDAGETDDLAGELHTAAVTPNSKVVRQGAGGGEAKPDPKPGSGTTSRRSTKRNPVKGGATKKRGTSTKRTATARRGSSKRKTATARKATAASTGEKKISAIVAAETILRKSPEPLHVNEITKRIMAMKGTKLGGKTPEASVGAILAVSSKKKDSPFKRTAPSTYTVKTR